MSSTTSSEQKSSPPAWAQPLFEQSAQDALSLYQSQPEIMPYQGSTVADLSDTTMQGVNQLAQAGQNWDTAGTRPLFGQIGASAVMPSYAEQNLGDIASGQDNPHFEQALSNRLEDVSARVQSGMSGAGRYGSGAHTGVLTNELGDLSTQAMSDQWNQNIQNMFGANQLMDTARFGGLDRAQQAAGAMAGLDQQNFQNMLTGAGATLDAGGILDTQAQRQRSDEVSKYYEAATAPWQGLGLLQSAAAGAAGPYGQQIGQSRTSNPAAVLGGMGGLFKGKGS